MQSIQPEGHSWSVRFAVYGVFRVQGSGTEMTKVKVSAQARTTGEVTNLPLGPKDPIIGYLGFG